MVGWIQKNNAKTLVTLLLVAVLATLPLTIVKPGHTSAQLSACDASVSPQTVSPNTDNSVVFGISNQSANNIRWIKITKPVGADMTVVSASAYQWSANTDADSATFTGGSMTSGASLNFSLEVQTGGSTSAPASWIVQASDSSSGSNPISCDGDTSMGSENQPSQITISNINISDLSSSGITITWDTDVASTTQVDYGLDGNYGTSSPLDSNLVTSHSVTLTGLQANTGYHYQVTSTTPADGGTTTSGDNTFLTAVKPTSSTGDGSTSTPVVVTNPKIPIVISPDSEKVAPTISLTSSIPRILKQTPTVKGVADDNVAVAAVEYSTDGGKNWLPADVMTGLGSKHVSFSFTPLNLNDGNYLVVVRAVDTSGNSARTPVMTWVIDRLPPLVGGNVVSAGPLVMDPSGNGTIKTLEGVDQKVTLSAVGGPTSITLNAITTVKTKGSKKVYAANFSLTYAEDTGLWSGITGFTRPGTYTLTAHAIDGAGNKTSRVLSTIFVSPSARSLDKATNKPLQTTVTAYYLEPESHSWVVWNGAAFGQKNPQRTDKSGDFSMLLPAGTYYVSATVPGYHKFVSSIFTVHKPTPLTADLSLEKLHGLHLGSHYLSLPSFKVQHLSIDTTSGKAGQNLLVGKQAPDFNLKDTTGATVQAADLLGKPTLLSFNAAWSPSTSEQLPALNALQANHDVNVIPVASQETSGLVQAYSDIANLQLRWLADPNGSLSSAYNVQGLPMHYFIDKKGIVRQVVTGVLTKQQLLDYLSGL